MLRRRAVLAALLPVAACRSPEPTLYTLLPVQGPTRRGGPRTITVREVSLARYLDRVQIVRSAAEYRVEVAGNEWWAESLDAMMTRLLVENLAQRLPGTNVIASGGAITTVVPDVVVEVNLQRLGLTAPQTLTLTAQVSVSWRDSRRTPVSRTASATAPVQGGATSDFVAAASTAAGELADQVAAAVTR
ncbi:PqiC family protein [Falsiroseomonas sp. HW251]|uniref:PqiC family protein n=1 Tax=Falsiroseomonas sp. HW251 TaxID=3390998 RepID=UPI003D3242E3